MNSSSQTTSSLAALALASLLFVPLTSCASPPTRPVERSVSATERLAERYTGLDASLDGVVEALGAMRGTVERQGIIRRESVAVGDIKQGFGGLRSSISGLKKSLKDVGATQKALGQSIEHYLAEWDKQIAAFDSDDLKASAKQRHAAAKARHSELAAELTEAAPAFERYVAQLTELETALSHDLTAEGVGALRGVIEDAAEGAAPLKAEARRLADDVRAYTESLIASKPQE